MNNESASVPKRFVLTGAPGCGKTSILRALHEQHGYTVVGEAATDVIAREQARGVDAPWVDAAFIDSVVAVQRARQQRPVNAPTQVYDRSPVCTLALVRYLGFPVSATLSAEIERIIRNRVYERRVFFVRPIGFVLATAARRISFADSLDFERMHEEVYAELGYERVDIPAGAVTDRAALVDARIRSWQ